MYFPSGKCNDHRSFSKTKPSTTEIKTQIGTFGKHKKTNICMTKLNDIPY